MPSAKNQKQSKSFKPPHGNKPSPPSPPPLPPTEKASPTFSRVVIPQKALDSKAIRDKIRAMHKFKISPQEIDTIVEGLSHSKPKPTPEARKLLSSNNNSNSSTTTHANMFSVRLPRNVIVAKNEARKLATTMMSIELGNTSHDEKEVQLMKIRTTKSRSLVRDLRASDESDDSLCHDRTAALLDLRMQNLRNQANQLGLQIKHSEKNYDERRRRNRIAKLLADAQTVQYDPLTVEIMTELVHGDHHKALLLVSMTPAPEISPIIECYTQLNQAKEKSLERLQYTPTLMHMLDSIKTEYHQGVLKTEALRKALDVVSERLKEFRHLSIAMNHATAVGEERLDAINTELAQNRYVFFFLLLLLLVLTFEN